MVSTCETCKKEFRWTRLARPRKYCSRRCANYPKRNSAYYHCAACGVEFRVAKSSLQTKYCGRACYNKHCRGENHGLFKTGRRKGYKLMTGANRGFEHTEIAEKALGRKLAKGEVVHHIDGDKTNNRNDNLLICTVGYHTQLHHRMSELYMQEHFR